MRKTISFALALAMILAGCASPAPASTVTAAPSATHTAAPTSTITPTATATLTPTPSLPSYGVIDPNIGEKLKAEGIVVPEELKNPEYKLDLATEYQKTEWGNAYGIDIPITVIPERGIAYGKYHIKGIGATQEAWNAYAEQHIKYMWIHYREYGDPADREITLEQYVELLKAGRGGFEIPQYNPETGFFDKKAMVNPLSGYVKVISDNKYKELPTKLDSYGSGLFYVDENGTMWIARNDFEYTIGEWMDPKNQRYKTKPYLRRVDVAYRLSSGIGIVGIRSNFCLATDVMSTACINDSGKVEAKYRDLSVGLPALYNQWVKEYEAGNHDTQPPVWIED